MQLFHFIAAWLFPGAAVCAAAKVATTKAMTTESSEPETASSLAFSVKAAGDDSGSSISSSSSSSSTSDDHPRFFASRHHHQQQKSPPASPLCFGAGGAAVRLLRGSRAGRAPSPAKHEAAAAASKAPAPVTKGDVVARYLRKISRRLRKARAAAASKGSSPPSPGGGACDDTAREMADSVARAIAYCKDTLRRGAAPPPPLPSPSLGDLLHGRQEEIVGSAAAHRVGTTDSKTTLPPLPRRGIECTLPRPHRAAASVLAEMQATGKQDQDSTRPASPSRRISTTESDVVHGKEPPHHGHNAVDTMTMAMAEPEVSASPGDLALAVDEMGMLGSSFDEMEFLKIFDEDEEMIGHHFITIQTRTIRLSTCLKFCIEKTSEKGKE